MSAAAILPANADAVDTTSPRRRALNPWLVALAVVVPTFMEVLDTIIANVALRYIAGGLSAAITDSEWVLTSYLAANAVVLPISGYLAARPVGTACVAEGRNGKPFDALAVRLHVGWRIACT